ncbi:MAG: ThuA domain-containing protein [Bryobacterales bacterium]|nr:ThuA domain-containing protein [Bryobacterales bacterium]
MLRRPWVLLLLVLLGCAPAFAARRILFLTHSAGFRHDSIRTAVRVFDELGRRSGKFEVTATEDVSQLNAASLAQYDAVFFFTSGELPVTDRQKQDLLDFVRGGKGFGGAHSATDTFYGWAEYGELIGAYFDGHPWVHEAAIDIEDPDFPGLREHAPGFRIVEEFYQFRAFSRDRVRVLMTLDPATIDLTLPGVNRRDNDFALAWCHRYGNGRVFYTALGHFDETWTDRRFMAMLEQALLWLVGEVEADAAPRSTSRSLRPEIAEGGIGSPVGAATVHAPGSVVALYGRNLTSGSTLSAGLDRFPDRLAGTMVEVNGRPAPMIYAAPEQVNVQLPYTVEPGGEARLTVRSVQLASPEVRIRITEAAPVILNGAVSAGQVRLMGAGLGVVEGDPALGRPAPFGQVHPARLRPRVLVNGREAALRSAGLASGLIGVYEVIAALPEGAVGPYEVQLESAGQSSNRISIP